MDITTASKADLNAVFRLEGEAFGAHGYPDFFLRQALDCWGDGFYVAKEAQGDDVAEDENLLGYLLKVPSSRANNDHWILSLAVSSLARRRGIGRQLIAQCMNSISAGQRLLLTVDPDNSAALQLYLSLGFVVISEEADYFAKHETRLTMAYVA